MLRTPYKFATQPEEFCTSMHRALQNPEYEIKQKVLQLVVDRIVVDEQQLTIRHVVPTGRSNCKQDRKAPILRYE